MLDHLFGSQARASIIKFFCTHETEKFFVRELSRRLDITLNSLTRELENLVAVGLLTSELVDQKKYYAVDPAFPLLPELRSLIIKSILLLEKVIVRELKDLRGLSVLMLTGIFIDHDTGTDIVVVGTMDRKRIGRLIAVLSKSFHQELRFTYLTPAEYKYRVEVSDKFLYTILNMSPIVISNKFNQRP
mgnify:CR=1 FL=1